MSRSKWLMIGAGAVAIVRYIGLFLHAEGGAVHGWLWDVVNGASGAGMAVLEAIGIWHCWSAWAVAQPGRMRNTLMLLIIGIFASITVMVAPYVYSASQVGATSATLVALSPFALWMWAMAVTVAPLLIMAGAGLADTLANGSVNAQQSQGGAVEVEQVVAAMLSNYEAKIGNLLSSFASVADVQQAFDRVDSRLRKLQHAEQPAQPEVADIAQHEPVEVADVAQPAQLASGIAWSVDNLRNILEQHPDISATDARNLFADPPTRQAVASAIARLKGGAK